ncbi:unnamed protein product [Pylaiella littoralis]
MELIFACAKQNRASQTKYGKVWKALVSCTEMVLASGRGVMIEKLGTVTYISRSVREGARTGHEGCIFVINPKFARTFSVLQRAAPQRSLLAPAVPISSARIGHTAGIDHDYTRIALAAVVDAIGRRVCSGSTLRVPFGGVGYLVAKDRTLSFAFADTFRRPRMTPASAQDKYDNDVRRIMAALDAKIRLESSPRSAATTAAGRRVVWEQNTGSAPTKNNNTQSASTSPRPSRSSGGRSSGGSSSRSGSCRNGAAPEPDLVSERSSGLSAGGSAGAGRRRSSSGRSTHVAPAEAALAAAAAAAAARSRQQGALAHRERPATPGSRPTIAGAAAMVAGGGRLGHDEVTAAVSAVAAAAVDKRAAGTAAAGEGRMGRVGDDDISPRTAKKVLPHFLAIGNPGSQALVAKEGAEIVQRQARDRFAKVRAANLLLDEKELNETKKRQASKTTIIEHAYMHA